MHIASALTVVRRAPVQSDAPAPQALAPPSSIGMPPIATPATRAPSWRTALPGAILIAALALLGGLFPILF
jgi:hypothetical protein